MVVSSRVAYRKVAMTLLHCHLQSPALVCMQLMDSFVSPFCSSCSCKVICAYCLICRRSARLAAVGSDTLTPASPAPLGRQDPNAQQPPAAVRQRQQQQRGSGATAVSAGSADSENAPAGDGAASAAGEGSSYHWQEVQPPAVKSQQQQDQVAWSSHRMDSSMHCT